VSAQIPDNLHFVRVGESCPSTEVYLLSGQEQLSGQAFQQDMLLSYRGYQYTVYYNRTRNMCLARRKLPLGAWHEIAFPYQNNEDDAHNVISLGICKNDGTIHLAYDHHNDPLHYCRSVVGLANQPETMKWTVDNFSATTSVLIPGVAVPDVTYPRFISKPDGNLLFECRYKLSGDGDSYLREYDGATHRWSLVGRYVQGMDANPNACAYINRMDYDCLGRLHVSWCWRDDFGGGSNHDIFYGYSEDDGRTWKNNAGMQVAVTETINPTDSRASGACMRQGISSLQIAAIPYNRGYINQESQSSDRQGRVHILNSYIPSGQADDSNWANSRAKARLHHRFRRADGVWVVNQVKKNGTAVHSYCRSQVIADAFDNAIVVANGAEVYAATSANNYSDWGLISEIDKDRFCSEPQIDHPRLLEDGVLSFVYIGRDRKITVIDYLTDNPHQLSGAGLAYSFNNGKVWSGALETVYGEQYTLYLDTSFPAQVFVDGRLLMEKTTAGQEEISAAIPLIASHKHAITIKISSSDASVVSPALSWSSAHTVKSPVPAAALYPDMEIQDDAQHPYPYSPDLPELQNFGGENVAPLDAFMPGLNDFTLEVTATGIPIIIGNNYIVYAPSGSGTVRFAQKDGVVYVYENGIYKTALKPQVAMAFPDIFNATDDATAQTGIYDVRNLFSNPGFETVGEYVSGYDPVTRPADVRSKPADWYTLASYYGSSRANNLTVNTGYAALRPLAEGDYAFMLHGYGSGNEGMSLWQRLYGLLPATAYKVAYRHLSHGDTSPAGAGYMIRIGGYFADYFAEYSYGNSAQGFGNYTDVNFAFVTPQTLPNAAYFFVSRSATSIAHFDRMTLVVGTTDLGQGFSGVSSAVYLAGTAYAPGAATSIASPIATHRPVKAYSDDKYLYIDNPSSIFANIRVYDMFGKNIIQQTCDQSRSSFKLSSGVYLVVVSHAGNAYCTKICIQ
jgi:hypothetical protein